MSPTFEERLREALLEAAVRQAQREDLIEILNYVVGEQPTDRIGHIHFYCDDPDDPTTYFIASSWPDPIFRIEN